MRQNDLNDRSGKKDGHDDKQITQTQKERTQQVGCSASWSKETAHAHLRSSASEEFFYFIAWNLQQKSDNNEIKLVATLAPSHKHTWYFTLSLQVLCLLRIRQRHNLLLSVTARKLAPNAP
eukprot:1494643-Amphidinium_carterae.1